MKTRTEKPRPIRSTGFGQLTLVEHALCPLDPRVSLVKNLVHEASYFFMDRNRNWRKSQARIACPLGLSAHDEFYLWGLLALSLRESHSGGEFHATPHFCLRQFGMIDAHDRRCGKYYRLFASAIERLSFVRYKNDHFYDPIRGEQRKVSFGFFSYSLPRDPESSRTWRIAWDPIFLEFVKATSGHLRFDLNVYREMDPASRRLFLVLAKIFHRRERTPQFDLRHLAVDILGFSPTLLARDLKRKVGCCIDRLRGLGIVSAQTADLLFQKKAPGEYVFTLLRGAYFENRLYVKPDTDTALTDSPLWEPLRTIGFEDAAISTLVRRYPIGLMWEWIDITLAALERNGPSFFKKSPQAYFIDNVKHASKGTRTPPDWWRELRKAEFEFAGRKKVVPMPFTRKGTQPEPAREIVRRILDSTGQPVGVVPE